MDDTNIKDTNTNKELINQNDQNHDDKNHHDMNHDDLDKFMKFISGTIFKYEDEPFPKYFFNSYMAGDNILYQKNISETKMFDDEWITTLESYFPSIDKITKNPRSFIKYVEEVVDIERAKKTNSRSIQHLAGHSEYIKEVGKDKSIIPSKILTTHNEQDFEIYENRFVSTLINRMFIFVRNRYEVIKNNVESYQRDHFKLTSKFDLEGNNVDMTIDLEVKRDLDNKTINEHNHELLNRVEKLAGLIDGLKGSQFMKMMKQAKPVHPPIIRTNLINKNPDFRNAYTLWLFLDHYSILGYDVDVKEKDLVFDASFKKYLDGLALLTFSTIVGNQEARKTKYDAIEYEEYTKKKKKVSHKDAEDFVDNPDLIQMEDNSINEFFLNKYRKLFDQSVEELKENGEVETDEAIRRAIRKTMDIVNSLYESVFRVEEENDVFRQLVDKTNYEKEYEIKKNQLKYTRITREVKEVDYNRSIRTEKRLIKELEKLNTKFLKQKLLEKNKEKNALKKAELEAQLKNLQRTNEDYAKRLENLEKIDNLNKDEKEILKEIRQKQSESIKKEVTLYNEEIKKKESLELDTLRNSIKELTKLEKSNKAREEKAQEIRKEKMAKLVEQENEKRKEYLLKEKEKLLKKLEEKNAKEKQELERQKLIQEQKQKAIKEAALQKEREELAIMKVKAYEERMKLEIEVKKLRSKL